MFPDKGKSVTSVGIQKIEPSGLKTQYNNSESKNGYPLNRNINRYSKPTGKSEMAKQIIKFLGGRINEQE